MAIRDGRKALLSIVSIVFGVGHPASATWCVSIVGAELPVLPIDLATY
ncbi:MAG: hypothetical protein ACN6O8_03720 [Achromobacter sp.]